MRPKTAHKPRSANPIDVHVGGVLRQLRQGANYSQERLGDESGVTFQQIQKYERGANRIGASRLFKFSQIFDVSPAKFYEGLTDKKTRDDKRLLSVRLFQHPRGAKVAKAFLDIDNADWENQVIGLCRTLSKEKVP